MTKMVRGRKSVARQSTGSRLRRTWATTVEAITAAESDMEKQVKALLKRNKISTKDASAMFKDLSSLVGRERKKALREFESRLSAIQHRALNALRKQIGNEPTPSAAAAEARLDAISRYPELPKTANTSPGAPCA